MRILYICSNYRPVTTGGAIRCQTNAEEWARLGHTVTVVTNFPNTPVRDGLNRYSQKLFNKEVLNGVTVVRVPSFIVQSKSMIAQLSEFLSFMFTATIATLFLSRTNVVVASSPQLFCGPAGWLASIFHWRLFVFEVRDLWPDSIAALQTVRNASLLAPLFWLEKFLYNRAAKIVAVTDRAGQAIVTKGVSSEKVEIIYNGADLATLTQETTPEFKSGLGLAGNFVVSYIGTMGVAQRPDLILQTARILQRHNEDVHFLIVGPGAMQQKMQENAIASGATNITFIPTVPHEQIIDYWNASDVTLSLLKDNRVFKGVIPSKVFEAFATRTPLITNVTGALGEIADQNHAMVVVPPDDDPEALAAEILELKNHPQKMASLAKAGYEIAVQYDRKKLARDMVELLGAVANIRA